MDGSQDRLFAPISTTRIDFVATPATADDMKGVKLTFDTNTVSLKVGS